MILIISISSKDRTTHGKIYSYGKKAEAGGPKAYVYNRHF